MSQPLRQLLPLWDYGWLDHNEVRLPACRDAQDLIAAYLRSDTFGTSFVGSNLEQAADLHGPFERASIKANDFQVISQAEFQDQVQAIRQPEGFSEPASDEQWQAVQLLISELQQRCSWIMMLRLTEEDSENFHDWGFVLTIFREFLFAYPNSEQVSRLVFGCD